MIFLSERAHAQKPFSLLACLVFVVFEIKKERNVASISIILSFCYCNWESNFNMMVKPYKRFQSQGHIEKKVGAYRYSKFNAFACVDVLPLPNHCDLA